MRYQVGEGTNEVAAAKRESNITRTRDIISSERSNAHLFCKLNALPKLLPDCVQRQLRRCDGQGICRDLRRMDMSTMLANWKSEGRVEHIQLDTLTR